MIRLSLALVAASLACGSARAADDSAFAASIFNEPAPSSKARACFVRHYDAPHMAQHPKQKVTDMMLLVGREKSPDEPGLRWQFQLSTHFTDRKGRFESGGDCSAGGADGKPANRLTCMVECDGGDILVTNGVDAKSVTARVEGLRIWRAGKTMEDAGAEDVIAGADDKNFRLERADIAECTPLLPKKERERLLSRKKK
jgi:hypothetical protein